MFIYQRVYQGIPFFDTYTLLVLNVGNGWVAAGCWDDYY